MAAFIDPVTQEIMTDAVSAACGHTFDRQTLVNIDAHRGYHGRWECPCCRAAWAASFTPSSPSNFAINDAIAAALASGALARTPSGSVVGPAAGLAAPVAVPVAATPTPPIELKVQRIADTDNVLVTLSTADVATSTIPINVIVALDNSGSMGEPSADPVTQKKSDAAAFNRSDLVRHSWATIPPLLGPTNKGALLLWDNANKVALEPTLMTASGISAAKRCEALIRPSGGTNIWGGLLAALTIAARPENKDAHNVILFQTDGESDPTYSPASGIPNAFRKWRDANPTVKVTVNTIGYGYGDRLDTVLLRELAEIGGGTYGYVPDGGMVGSTIIHQLGNLMSCQHRGVQIQVPELGLHVPVGFLQGGQERTVMLRIPRDSSVTVSVRSDTIPESVSFDLTPESPSITAAEAAWPLAHRRFTDELHMAFTRAETAPGPSRDLIAHIVDDLTPLAAAEPRIAALVSDLSHPHSEKGQIGKAFEPTAFSRWGRHYLPGVLCGHQNQWPINFKDAGSNIFSAPGSVTRRLIDEGDTLFNTLPPPTATIAAAQYASARAASIAVGAPPPPPPAALRMASMIGVSSGPCFLGASRMLMVDGTEKRCDQVRPGDVERDGHRILCVLKTEVTTADIVRLEDRSQRPLDAPPLEESGGFTQWHPVWNKATGLWTHPNTLGKVESVDTHAVYNFVLDFPEGDEDGLRGSTVTINGLQTVTLAHSLYNPIARHPYFGHREEGKRNILDDLRASPGWADGYVVWRNVDISRDPDTGLVCKMTSE